MRKLMLLLATVALGSCGAVFAQNPKVGDVGNNTPKKEKEVAVKPHVHEAQKMINGADTPAAIPDMVAYRVWLHSASHAADPSSFVGMVGVISKMDATDQGQLVTILASFKVQDDQLVYTYNHSSSVLNNGDNTADAAAYAAGLTALVQQTNATIQTLLSPIGFTQYKAFIQWHKSYISCPEGLTI